MILSWSVVLKKRLVKIFVTIAAGYAFVWVLYAIYLFSLYKLEFNKEAHYNSAIQYTLPSLNRAAFDSEVQVAINGLQEAYSNISVVKILIASTWRSGSTLLGEILSSYPGAFYHYEPLMMHGFTSVNEDDDEPLNLLQKLLQCNYSESFQYLKFAQENTDIFKRNIKLWRICSAIGRKKCYIPEILNYLCSMFPIHIMKLVRVRLSVLEEFLRNNYKVIWLIRDPRGTISSRLFNVKWCKSITCADSSVLCEELNKDYHSYLQLKKKYPNNIILVRYEDLTEHPKEIVSNILRISGLKIVGEIFEYLKFHLSTEYEAPWSTIHNSKKRSNRWKEITPWNTVAETQYNCRTEMKYFGYNRANNEQELKNSRTISTLHIP